MIAATEDLHIPASVDLHIPASVFARSVDLNLLSSAIEFTPEGDGRGRRPCSGLRRAALTMRGGPSSRDEASS